MIKKEIFLQEISLQLYYGKKFGKESNLYNVYLKRTIVIIFKAWQLPYRKKNKLR